MEAGCCVRPVGACGEHRAADKCRTSREGTRCAWANDKICMTPETARQRLDSKNIETVQAPRCAKLGKLYADEVSYYNDV